MKKLLIMFGVMALAATAFTGCSDDDDPNFGKAAAGTYDATLKVTIGDGDEFPLPENAELTITRKSDTKAVIKAVAAIPGETPTPITVETKDKDATLSGKLADMKINYEGTIDLSASLGEANKAIKTTITGTIKDEKTMDLTITLKGVIGLDTEDPTKAHDMIVKTTGATKK